MTPNGFPGGQAIFLFIPLVIIVVALWVLTVAMRDQAGRPKHGLPRLPDPNSHPLHHVRVSMAATKRKARVAARKAKAAAPPPPDEQTGEVRRLDKQA